MNKKDVDVFIYSSEGRIVKRDIIKSKPYRIDVDTLKSGIFFIEQITNKEIPKGKLVKM